MNTCELLIEEELKRQKGSINLIASENFLPKTTLKLAGNHFLNKYAEGYPGKRYYQGCDIVDKLEQLCINEACIVFNSNYANVQPHSGSQANEAVLNALLQPGDKVLYLDLKHGGHLSHGFHANLSGKIYTTETYIIGNDGRIDMNYFKQKFHIFKPKLVIIGFSSYVFDINFSEFKSIIQNDALILADISHTSGLIISGLLNHPFPWADIIVSTTHKSLFGPRGGVILWNDSKFTNAINRSVFPGIQGGPNMADILLKLNAFQYVQTPVFYDYSKQVINNSKSLYKSLVEQDLNAIYGTENHICLIDVKVDAKPLVKKLEKYGIITNFNFLAGNEIIPTGIRLGTYAMTTRGWKENEFRVLAEVIKDITLEYDIYTIDKRITNLLQQCSNDKELF